MGTHGSVSALLHSHLPDTGLHAMHSCCCAAAELFCCQLLTAHGLALQASSQQA